MIQPTKKIVLATLVIAMGWGLSWPFRKEHRPADIPSHNLGHNSHSDKRKPGADTVSPIQPSTAKFPFVEEPKRAGTLIATARLTVPPMLPPSPANRSPSTHAGLGPTKLPSKALDHPVEPSNSLPAQTSTATSPIFLPPMNLTNGNSDPLNFDASPYVTRRLPAPTIKNVAAPLPNKYEPEYAFPKQSLPQEQEMSSLALADDIRPRPAYATISSNSTDAHLTASNWPREIFHEIQNSDTLEKLAKRYLGDPARALEIFDLNRDKLKNPELLPIGEELRIPTRH